MKTLDEVIEKCQENVDLVNRGEWEVDCFLSHEYMVDALHYLKEYRNCGDCAYADSYLRCAQDSRNDPLDWETLKQMEGKPVWVEEYGREYATPHWEIHNGIEKGYDGDEILYLEPFETFTKNDMGKTWQAYRKERTE